MLGNVSLPFTSRQPSFMIPIPGTHLSEANFVALTSPLFSVNHRMYLLIK